MKKIVVPAVILILGILVAIGAFIVVKGRKTVEKPVDESLLEETVPEIALVKRPVVSLTPSADGHWLKLEIQKIVIEAASMDYELTYRVPDGRTQGVPGTTKLTGNETIVKDLLLGSESSGKFRYDEGVENGNLLLKFRNTQGKLVAKFSTDFYIQKGKTDLTYFGGESYVLDKVNIKTFYVSMDTIGYLGDPPEEPKYSYGIFSSSAKGNSGSITKSDTYLWNGDTWDKIEGKSANVGFFVALN